MLCLKSLICYRVLDKLDNIRKTMMINPTISHTDFFVWAPYGYGLSIFDFTHL